MALIRPTIPLSRPTIPLQIPPLGNVMKSRNVLLREDGTILYSKSAVRLSTDAVFVVQADDVIIGIDKNGKCMFDTEFFYNNYGYEKMYNKHGELNILDWKDIVEIGAFKRYYTNYDDKSVYYHAHTVGLKKDGTCVAVGINKYGECDVSSWTNIVKIYCTSDLTIGITSDGKCILAGSVTTSLSEVSSWTDIVKLKLQGYYGDYMIGLKSDGTCVCTSNTPNEIKTQVESWSDIVDICNGDYQVVGLKSDGTCVMAYRNSVVDSEKAQREKIKEIFDKYYVVSLADYSSSFDCICSNGKCFEVCSPTYVPEWMLLVPSPKYLYRCGDTVYGYNNGTFGQLTTGWGAMSDDDKISMFNGTNKMKATKADIASITGNSLVVMEHTNVATDVHIDVEAVPKAQIIKYVSLIETSSFEWLNKMIIKSNTSGNGVIKVAITVNNTDYFVYDRPSESWISIQSTTTALLANGMTPGQLYAIPKTSWDDILTYTSGSGVGLAYVLDVDEFDDVAEVDTLTFNVAVPYDV